MLFEEIWNRMAEHVEWDYGCQVDWEEKFFICPDCGEPVYCDDWDWHDFLDDGNNDCCPICGFVIE
jgi:hypothetical protein